jgi:hypothetical protein
MLSANAPKQTPMKEAESMTLHKALSELKLIEGKITKRMGDIVPVGIFQKNNKIDGYVTPEDFDKNAQSLYQSITDLFERQQTIKSALMKKNLEVIIDIAGLKMSIADALNYKSTLPLRKNFVHILKQKYIQTVGRMNTDNEKVSKNLDIILSGQQDKSSEAMKKFTDNYKEVNEFHLQNPLKIEEKFKGMEEQIEKFETELDGLLSETNALHTITI